MFWLLIRTRAKAARNVTRDHWLRQPVLTMALTIGAIGLFGVICVGFLLFFEFAAGMGVLTETTYQAFYYLFLLLLAGAVPFVAATLLQSEDYNLLFAAPVEPRTVIASKLLDATITNSIQFSVLGLPAIVAMSSALGLSPAQWLLVPLLISLFLLLPALLTAFGLLVALACVGMRRLRSAITLINVLMGVIVCLSFVAETRNLPFKFGGSLRLATMRPAFDVTSVPAHALPSQWFATALTSLGKHNTASATAALLRILVADSVLFVASMMLGGRLLSVASLAEGLGTGMINARRNRPQIAWGARVSRPLLGIIIKDWKFLLRDPMLLSQMSVPLILYAVPFLVGWQDQKLGRLTDIYPFAVAITGFIVYMQTSILSLSLLGMEAQSFWVLLTAPDRRRSILIGKWLLCTMVCSSVGIALGVFAGLVYRAGPLTIAIQVIVTLVGAGALCALGIGVSAVFPRFQHDNPAVRVSPWALIIGFLTASGYVVVSCLIFGVCAYLISLHGSKGPILGICTLLYVLLTLVVTVVPLAFGARCIERYEWQH